MKQQDFFRTLNKELKKKNFNDYIICTGCGNHQMFAAQYINWKATNYYTSGSLGVMGSCIPYAIGAAIANPDKKILAIDGDGSFNMTMQDLKTIKRYNLQNIKIAVMNDG